MDLKTYFSNLNDEEKEEFAQAAGTKPVYIRQIIGDHRKPSPELAKRIHEASGHRIPLAAIRPDIWSAA